MIPLAVGMKAHLMYFLFRRELEIILVRIVWKNQSFSSGFRGFWNCDLEIGLLNRFW